MTLSAREGWTLGQDIRSVVDNREATRANYDDGDYDTALLSVEPPRKIGEKEARALRVSKSITGSVVAAATYFQDESLQGLPLRHIAVGYDGSATGIFNGSLNANEYDLPSQYAQELRDDMGAENYPH